MSEAQHRPVNSVAIWGVLVAALALSLVLGVLAPSPLTIAIIFVIAAVKAYLVLAYFVHLSVEPRFIKVIVASILLLLVVLYIGLVPDILVVYGRMDGP